MKYLIVIGLAVIFTIPGGGSLSFTEMLSSSFDKIMGFMENVETQVNFDIGQKQVGNLNRIKRSTLPSWKLSFKKYQRSQRKNPKQYFYKTWRPIPFVPIIRVRPTPPLSTTNLNGTNATTTTANSNGTATVGTSPAQKPDDNKGPAKQSEAGASAGTLAAGLALANVGSANPTPESPAPANPPAS